MADVERLTLERRRILFWFTAIYAIWYGALIVALSGWVHSSLVFVFDATAAIGGLVWCGITVWLYRWSRRARACRQALAALEDELTVRNRLHAQRASMFVMLGCLMIGLAVSTFVKVDVRLAFQLLIWVMVVTQLGSFLWYDRG